MYFTYIRYEIYNVAVLHDRRPAVAAAGALINQGGKLVLGDLGLTYLCSCRTPVLPELRGKVGEKTPRSGR
jgi:hypothetical protein